MIGKDETKRENKMRRSIFAVWIVLTVAVAVYVGIAGPLTSQLGNDMWVIGVVVPPLMIILAGVGVAWLVSLCTGDNRHDVAKRNVSE